ncbi:MAG: ABC transporter permease [Vicinamibacterales bacterium]
MSLRGVRVVAGVEASKLAYQLKVRLVLAVCAAGPFLFAAVMRIQDSLPSDTLFGRAVKESGFAAPLVILAFASLWGFPAISSVVGGDLFSSEDRFGTWKTLLTRGRSRAEVFAGKILIAIGFAWLALLVLALSSLAAGVLVLGSGPLIDLSGVLRPAPDAVRLVCLAWASAMLPTGACAACAVMISILSRSSAAGIGVPVITALSMQPVALIDGAEIGRRLLLTSAFEAWHLLLTEPASYRPLLDASLVSITYALVALTVAYWTLQRRDIGG